MEDSSGSCGNYRFVCGTCVQVHPSDERIAAVILEIADFMLEFSTLGHEEAADIPQFVHPRIPNEVRACTSLLLLPNALPCPPNSSRVREALGKQYVWSGHLSMREQTKRTERTAHSGIKTIHFVPPSIRTWVHLACRF